MAQGDLKYLKAFYYILTGAVIGGLIIAVVVLVNNEICLSKEMSKQKNDIIEIKADIQNIKEVLDSKGFKDLNL